jgi:hypothetical protein
LTGWLGITVGALAVVIAAYALVWQSAFRASLPFGERAHAALRRGTRKAVRRTSREPPRPTTRSVSVALRGETQRAGAAPAILMQPSPKVNGTTREETVLKRKQPTEVHGGAREETVLKRKQPTSEQAVQALKKKRPATSDAQEVGVLKEKLATRPQQRRQRAPGLRPAAAPTGCRIDWWRGYVKSEFHAKLRSGDGSEVTFRSSPPFRWNKSTPPPKDLPDAVQAHAALVAELKAAGWIASGSGKHWYALELQRRQVPAGAERAT